MRSSSDIFIPIPKSRNTKVKVELNGDDLTNKVKKSLWFYPCTIGLGTFSINLLNAGGQLTGAYQAGQTAKFYADNSDGTTLQFWGRIDYVKEVIGEKGRFLEVEGRHRSFLLNESTVCYSATSTEPSVILKAIIDQLPDSYGFTYDDVTSTSKTMDVEWNYKPFWDCVIELCNFSEFDCYVDNDLDFHFFEKNSILNEEEAIVEGDKFINSRGLGINDYLEKTRVIAIGQDGGLPIVYTSVSSNEEDDIREVIIKDSSANTEEKVKDLADSKLLKLTNRTTQANINSFGLESIKPGENIWLLIPRQEVAGKYKLLQINHKFGQEYGGWRTESVIEEEDEGISQAIQLINQKSELISKSENVNKLDYSFNFNFDDDDKTGSHSSTKISPGKLILSSDAVSEGSWISTSKTAISNVSNVEMRVIGKDFWASKFYFSLNDRVTWEQIEVGEFETLVTPGGVGKNIRIKVELIIPTDSTINPEIDSLVLLYS